MWREDGDCIEGYGRDESDGNDTSPEGTRMTSLLQTFEICILVYSTECKDITFLYNFNLPFFFYREKGIDHVEQPVNASLF